MPIKQTIPANSSDSVQFGNATTPVAAQVTGAEVSTGNGYLAMSTTASGTVTEKMRIDSNGNVGIGLTNPTHALTLKSTSSTSGYALVDATYTHLLRNRGNTFDIIADTGTTGGDMRFFTNGITERMRIDSSGNVLINATSISQGGKFASVAGTNLPTAYFQISSSSGSQNAIDIVNTANSAYVAERFWVNGYAASLVGTISCTTTATAYNTSSDYRLKENVALMTGALDVVAQLKPVTYTWKSTGEASQGFIAHELQAVVPDCVTGEKDAIDADGNPVYQGIDTSFLVATLTAAIQELSAKVTALEAQLGAK